VDADLDTLVTALYVEIEDLIGRPRGRGRRPMLTPAELLCPAVMQVLLRYPSERHWLRYAREHLRGMFPYIPEQDGYNKRVRKAGPLLARVMRHLASPDPVLARLAAADRFHPAALRHLAGDRQTLRAGR
jgi:hypothetical protein